MTNPPELQNNTNAITIHRALEDLQWDLKNTRYLYYTPPIAGLGGLISGRIFTLFAGLALGRTARFIELADPPYDQVFEPMHLPVREKVNTANLSPLLYEGRQEDSIVVYDPIRCAPITQFDMERFSTIICEKYGIERIPHQIIEGYIFLWMSPVADISQYCGLAIERFGPDVNTLGVHWRRGDKATETAYVPADIINSSIEKLYLSWKFTRIFLASDSSRAIDELVAPRNVEVIFDYEETRYNNANHKMLIRSPELSKIETLTAFKNIILLSRCGGLIGQDNAHFAHIASSVIAARRESLRNILLISGGIAEENSIITKIYYNVYRKVRKFAKGKLPFLTANSRYRSD